MWGVGVGVGGGRADGGGEGEETDERGSMASTLLTVNVEKKQRTCREGGGRLGKKNALAIVLRSIRFVVRVKKSKDRGEIERWTHR